MNDLETSKAAIEAMMREIKVKHCAELEPHEAELKEIQRLLGPIYAGFKVGDILHKVPDRHGRVMKARVTYIISRHAKTYDAQGIIIRADGTDGQSVKLWHFDWSLKL